MVGGGVLMAASSLTVDRVEQAIYLLHPPIRRHLAGADSRNRAYVDTTAAYL